MAELQLMHILAVESNVHTEAPTNAYLFIELLVNVLDRDPLDGEWFDNSRQITCSHHEGHDGLPGSKYRRCTFNTSLVSICCCL